VFIVHCLKSGNGSFSFWGSWKLIVTTSQISTKFNVFVLQGAGRRESLETMLNYVIEKAVHIPLQYGLPFAALPV